MLIPLSKHVLTVTLFQGILYRILIRRITTVKRFINLEAKHTPVAKKFNLPCYCLARDCR